MNEFGYKITEIGNGTDSEFGEIIIVRANPFFEINTGIKTKGWRDEEEVFFFDNKKNIMDDLLRIANDELDWHPDEDEFETRYIVDQDTAEKVLVYCHNSLCDIDVREKDNESQTDVFQDGTECSTLTEVELRSSIDALKEVGVFFKDSSYLNFQILTFRCILAYFYDNVFHYGSYELFITKEEAEKRYYDTEKSLNIPINKEFILKDLVKNWTDVLKTVEQNKINSDNYNQSFDFVDVKLKEATISIEKLAGKKVPEIKCYKFNIYNITEDPSLQRPDPLPNFVNAFRNDIGPLYVRKPWQGKQIAVDYAISMVQSYWEKVGYVPMNTVLQICEQVSEAINILDDSVGDITQDTLKKILY